MTLTGGRERKSRKISIRPARREDEPFVLATARRLAAFGPPPWRTADEIVSGESRTLRAFFDASVPGTALRIAEIGTGAPAGFAFLESLVDYFTGETHGHIGILAVSETGEGRGVGGALLEDAERWARGLGYGKLTLNVFEANRHARAVYEHAGFAPETLRYSKRL